jgi:hypothetical protein
VYAKKILSFRDQIAAAQELACVSM